MPEFYQNQDPYRNLLLLAVFYSGGGRSPDDLEPSFVPISVFTDQQR
ncbi:MAG: hypothetical protein WBB82_15800 [Limnothrix sp.]